MVSDDILTTDPLGLGLLRSAPTLGALYVALYLTRRFIAVAIFGMVTMMFELSHSMVLSLVALVVLGTSDIINVIVQSTFLQLETPHAMRGRVSAVNSVFARTSNQLGEFESGITASWFGPVPAVLIGGIGTIVVVTLWIRLFPELFKVDRLTNMPDLAQHASQTAQK